MHTHMHAEYMHTYKHAQACEHPYIQDACIDAHMHPHAEHMSLNPKRGLRAPLARGHTADGGTGPENRMHAHMHPYRRHACIPPVIPSKVRAGGGGVPPSMSFRGEGGE